MEPQLYRPPTPPDRTIPTIDLTEENTIPYERAAEYINDVRDVLQAQQPLNQDTLKPLNPEVEFNERVHSHIFINRQVSSRQVSKRRLRQVIIRRKHNYLKIYNY